MGGPINVTLEQATLDKRLSLLEQAMNNGFTQLRLDLRNVLDEMVRRDADNQHKIEKLEGREDTTEKAVVELCREVALLQHQMQMLSRISWAMVVTVVGILIERVMAILW